MALPTKSPAESPASILNSLTKGYTEGASNKANFLIYGDMGTGKSYLLRTARKPVLVYLFDPGGLKALNSLIASGDIFVRLYEYEDSHHPTLFRQFEKDFEEDQKKGVHAAMGTVAIDSLTTMGDAVMNAVLAKSSRAGQVPQLQDYFLLQQTLRDVCKECCNLSADFVLTGHVGTDKDEISGKILTSLMVSGKSSVKLPILFDEVYVTQRTQVMKGTNKVDEYKLLTSSTNLFKARTRIGSEKFAQLEDPDLKALRKKAGMSDADLPKIV
jgi:hypothetical protein